jgi:predicted phosphoribosyltransferase
VVLALPNGGVVIATEVARTLTSPLDVIGVRKLRTPGEPELAVGAVAEDGV